MKRKNASQKSKDGTEEKEVDWKASRRNAIEARHTAVFELDLPEYAADRIFGLSDQLRIAGNVVSYEMGKRVRQMKATREFKMYWSIYRREAAKLATLTKDTPEYQEQDSVRKREFAPIADMMDRYGITLAEAYRIIEEAAEGMNLSSVFLQTRAEDIMDGVYDVLFDDGKEVHQLKKGELPAIRSKQMGSAILIKEKNGALDVSMKLPALGKTINKRFDRDVKRENNRRDRINRENAEKHSNEDPVPHLTQAEENDLKHRLKLELKEMFHFGVRIKDGDRFANDELHELIGFLSDPKAEEKAVEALKNGGPAVRLFRPCCASLVCETIRGRRRVFIHICVEGPALPKYDRNGNPRHKYGTGVMGVDLGPQSVGSATEKDARLENLAERDHKSTRLSERKEKQIQRYMDRSRREMNPEYYNPNGTIKKGRKWWKKSKRYLAAEEYLRNLRRRNAVSRHCAINEMVHMMRARADEIHIEPKNVKSMMKRAKPEKKDSKAATQANDQEQTGTLVAEKTKDTAKSVHKRKRRKRHGKSILNRCPGYFFDKLKQVFESTGGKFLVVAGKYRASQYDHTAKANIKKTLKDRMYALSDGTQVQRDLYSAFLLLCSKADLSAPDQSLCEKYFPGFLIHQKSVIREIKENHWKICNSGIKVS